jgi:hypothetical protein
MTIGMELDIMLCNIPLNKQGCNSPLHRLERLL